MTIARSNRLQKLTALCLLGAIVGIRVELAGIDERPLPGRSFADCDIVQGDQLWTTVTWRGQSDLGVAAGEGVVLRLQMDRAQLFGLEFK